MMNRKSGTWLLAGTLAALLLPTTPAEAQRDAGAKLRGDAGRYSGRTARPTPRAFSTQPNYAARPGYATQPGAAAVQPQPTEESYEAYSLQPLPFGVGDPVAVVGQPARLMRGRQVLGSVPAGRQLRVLQIRGPWVGVAAEIEGREVGGWLWYSQVAAADADR